jgi:hypothetical protein
MVMNVIQANAALTAGIQANFAHTYASSSKASREMVSQVIDMGQAAKARTVPLAYFQTTDYPEYWPYGEDIPEGNNQAIGYNVTIRRFAKRIKWLRDDVTDELTHTLKQRALQLGEHFGTLDERFLFQFLLSTVDPKLMPVTQNAPDGAALFSATDGASAARFGATGGNIVAGNGVVDVASIMRDYYRSIQRRVLFQDTQGQPLAQPGDEDRGIMVIYGVANKEMFERTFYGSIQQGIQAGISNPLRDTAKNFTLQETARITSNDWFVIVTGDPLKALGQFEIDGMETTEADWSNSDQARTQDVGYFQAKRRTGISVNLPYQIIQVDN